jgi:hypothetical protein|tara:strand:- start:366 stop:560 length:195 start_codon:yes stop_codon:yes gene_type:complete
MKKVNIELSQKELRILVRNCDRLSHRIANVDRREQFEDIVDKMHLALIDSGRDDINFSLKNLNK